MPLDVTSLFADLVRFETRLWNAVEARLVEEYELTFGRFEVLQAIASLPACRVNDIADHLAITWGGASKLVDRLEAAELCLRRPNPHDGRSSLVELTAGGKRIAADARKLVERELRAGFDGSLSAAALTQFASTVATLRADSDTWRSDAATA